MLALKLYKFPVRRDCLSAGLLLLITWVLITVPAPDAHAEETLYPQALMNWMVEGTFHALVVDKSQQRLSVWEVRNGQPSIVESYKCSTGENDGDKWVRGDMKTPEGVYFFCSVIDGRSLPAKYGLWAFTTDYPNFVDRRHGKSGDGIWLHGRDKPLNGKPDSEGCIALENQDLTKVSRFIRLQSTPLIVVDKTIMAPRSTILENERKIRDFIESWRSAWGSRDVDAFMGYYSNNFQSGWFDFAAWKEKKRKLNQRYKSIRVKLGNIYLYRQNGLITAIFTQLYTSDSFRSTGVKILYLTDAGGKFRVYAEDYHQPVDDVFPARTLLARTNNDDSKSGVDEKSNFRIRLVSTDEPDQSAYGETETPRPSAPSRGVVLEKLPASTSPESDSPHLDINEKYAADKQQERLIVARLMPAYGQIPSLEVRKTADKFMRTNTDWADAAGSNLVPPQEVGPSAGVGVAVVGALEQRHPEAATEPIMTNSEPNRTKSNTDLNQSGMSSGERKEILDFLNRWKRAWVQKDLDRFIKMYHPDFKDGRMDYKMFLKSKQNFFRKYGIIQVELDRVEIKKSDGTWLVKFLQSFQGDEYRDKGWKTMVLAGEKGQGFRIIEERWSPL
ncbi:MAG: L,D-transpeptidase family protein [Desulfomonilaceae bacterium]